MKDRLKLILVFFLLSLVFCLFSFRSEGLGNNRCEGLYEPMPHSFYGSPESYKLRSNGVYAGLIHERKEINLLVSSYYQGDPDDISKDLEVIELAAPNLSDNFKSVALTIRSVQSPYWRYCQPINTISFSTDFKLNSVDNYLSGREGYKSFNLDGLMIRGESLYQFDNNRQKVFFPIRLLQSNSSAYNLSLCSIRSISFSKITAFKCKMDNLRVISSSNPIKLKDPSLGNYPGLLKYTFEDLTEKLDGPAIYLLYIEYRFITTIYSSDYNEFTHLYIYLPPPKW